MSYSFLKQHCKWRLLLQLSNIMDIWITWMWSSWIQPLAIVAINALYYQQGPMNSLQDHETSGLQYLISFSFSLQSVSPLYFNIQLYTIKNTNTINKSRITGKLEKMPFMRCIIHIWATVSNCKQLNPAFMACWNIHCNCKHVY